eukprot:gene28405-34292_t
MLVERENPTEIVPAAKKSRSQTFYRLLSYAKPDSLRISLGLSALVVNSITNLSFPWLIGQALDHAHIEDVQSFLVKSGGFFLLGSLASWLRVYCLGSALENIIQRIRLDLFDSLLYQDLEYYESSRTGEVVKLLDEDVNAAAELLTEKIALLDEDVNAAAELLTEKIAAGLRSLNSSLNGSILLYRTSPKLTAVTLSVVPLIGVGAMTLARYARALNNSLRNAHSKLLSHSLDRVRCITTVRVNMKEQYERDKFREMLRDVEKVGGKKHHVQGVFMSFLNISTNLSLAMVLRVGGAMVSRGEVTVGTLTSFALQSAFVGLGFSGLSTFYSDVIKALDAADRVFQVMDVKRSAPQAIEAADAATPAAPLALPAGPQPLVLEGVEYSYPSRTQQRVLDCLSVSFGGKGGKGGLVAIRGRSGVGKSTLGGVLCGLYTPQQGVVRYGDAVLVDGRGQANSAVFGLVGVVEQSAHNILTSSLLENIAYGLSKDAVSMEKHEILNILKEIANRETTVIVLTHSEKVGEVADELYDMEDGKLNRLR